MQQTSEILSWTREEKLCISKQPLIILFTKYVTLTLQRHFCLTQHWLNYEKGQQVFLAQSFLFTLYPLGPFSHMHGSMHSRNNLNILLTTKSCLNSHFKIGRHCHSFMALNRVSDRSTGDWLSQTHVKNYGNFLCLMKQFIFSGGNHYKALQFI